MTVTGVHCIVKASSKAPTSLLGQGFKSQIRENGVYLHNVQLSIVDLIVFLEGVVCGAVNLYCVMSGFY